MVQSAYNVLTLLQVGICDGAMYLQCTYTVTRTFTVIVYNVQGFSHVTPEPGWKCIMCEAKPST